MPSASSICKRIKRKIYIKRLQIYGEEEWLKWRGGKEEIGGFFKNC
jgi:hypothetical protein